MTESCLQDKRRERERERKKKSSLSLSVYVWSLLSLNQDNLAPCHQSSFNPDGLPYLRHSCIRPTESLFDGGGEGCGGVVEGGSGSSREGVRVGHVSGDSVFSNSPWPLSDGRTSDLKCMLTNGQGD